MALHVSMVDGVGSHHFSAQCARNWEFDSKTIWMLEERGVDREGWMKPGGSQRWSCWMQL